MNTLLFIMFLLSLPVIAYFIIRAILAFIKKDKAQGIKRLKFAGISWVVMIVSFIAFIATSDSIEEVNEVDQEESVTEELEETPEEMPKEETPVVETSVTEDPIVEEPVVEEPVVEETKPKDVPTTEKVPASVEEPVKDNTWDDLKEQDKIVGKSDEDFSKVTKDKPREVRNDKTGKWRITKIAESIPIEKYALSYSDLYMKEDEVHFIVNFNYNTTTWLNKMGGILFVEVREYVKREEHDAEVLGSGMTLKSYTIYPDGDIEEVE